MAERGTDPWGLAAETPKRRRESALLASAKQLLPSHRVPPKVLLTVTSQLATMLGSGCDLCASLESMARQQQHPRMKLILADLHATVESGQPFSTALARYPDVFSSLYVAMVRAGESAGLMKSMLSSLQAMIRNQIRIANMVRSALLYPAILLCVAVVAILVMTTFVLPKFAAVFKAANAKLPASTLLVINASEFMAAHWIAVFAGLAAAIVGVALLLRQPFVKTVTHNYSLRLPVVGPTLRLSYVVRSVQTLGMLIKAGLPLAEAILLVRDLMPNLYYQEFYAALRSHIAEGKQMSPDFDHSSLFPPMVAQMISVGEQTGTLPAACLETAAFHEEELHEKIKLLTTMIEPAIIILLGGFVGFIAVSVILPMFRLSSSMH